MDHFDVVVIGAGPAGIFAALTCANAGSKVALIDKNKEIGRKILISGGGRCNLTQYEEMTDFVKNFGKNLNFTKPALLNFTNKDFIKFLNKNGLETTVAQNNKVFPKSKRASDVTQLLAKLLQKSGVFLISNTAVVDIKKDNSLFNIDIVSKTVKTSFVVIATGGTSFPTTGTTGDGHIFAKKLGHKIIPTNFALAPLFIKNFELTKFAGLSFVNIAYTHWRGERKIGSYSGDMLITHRGISGPGIMNNTRYMASNDVVKINFFNDNAETGRDKLINFLSKNPKITVKNCLEALDVPKRLMEYFLVCANIDGTLTCGQLKKDDRNKLITQLTAYPMQIKSVGCKNSAMVTAGGVSLKDVDSKTMASRRVSGLFFAGEVLDVDGDTGGYNIQFAVSSGVLAGESINKEML